MITPIYQPKNHSSHRLTQKFAKLYNTKATHTGTLDPMAEGVLVVLTNEDRFLKSTLKHNKVYRFSLLFGIKTDTDDLLGLITNLNIATLTQSVKSNFQKEIETKIVNFLDSYLKRESQQTHVFSAKRIGGTSVALLSQKKVLSKIGYQQTKLLSYSNLNFKIKKLNPLLDRIIDDIKRIKGRFRQVEIINQWQLIQQQLSENHFLELSLEITTTPKFYVRSLVRDLSIYLQLPITTSEIIRVQNGPYSISDCICLL